MENKINPEPDFIGIGAAKTGTTWIYEYLKEHKNICLSSKKETHFFDILGNYKKGLRYYYKFFSHCSKNKIKGEITPSYIYSYYTPFLIKKNFPNVKILVCLRDPIERAYSHYKYNIEMKGKFSIYKNLKETIKYDKEIIDRGLYYQQLKNYYNLFPKEQILVMFYKDLKKNPKEFIKKIYKFLEVDDPNYIPRIINKRIRKTGNKVVRLKVPFLSLIINKSYSVLNKITLLKTFIENSRIMSYLLEISDLNREITFTKNLKDPFLFPLNNEIRKHLNQFYEDDIQKLEKLLDKDLSFWK
ncbi:MAG: hypothetical protein EU529_04170 [Promethearchaeota archaeon]|nr:MAG: hypothetical protein EU529_04170 [Candidatus Lokiarchaeota archaeon]